MKFEEAVSWLKRGERIKRKDWKSAYLLMIDGKVKMTMPFRNPWYYQFRQHDITATDWLIKANPLLEDEEAEELKPLTGRLTYE